MKINHAQGYLERYSKTEKAKLGDITLNGPVTIDELDPKLVEEAVNAAKILMSPLFLPAQIAIMRPKLQTARAWICLLDRKN